MRHSIKRWSSLAVFCMLAVHCATAQAVLLDVGPTVPEVLNSSPPKHGFPLWYRDTGRIPLELCLSKTTSPTVAGAPMCILLAGPTFDPAGPIVYPTNFPDESFWWTGDARARSTKIGSRLDGTLTMALEGALSTGAPGSQVTFARIRYRIQTDVAGTYTVTHPYGQKTFFNVPAGADAINYTEDIGLTVGKFDGLLQGQIGPFLVWDTGPVNVNGELFVGDPSVPHTVTGSPFGTNFFRIEGPGAPADNFAETNQFDISGKIYQQPIPTPLTADRAIYAREAGKASVSVFATSQPVANVTNSLATFPGNFLLAGVPTNLQLTGTGIPTKVMTAQNATDGKFFAYSGQFPDPVTMPATIRVTNTADIPPTAVNVPLVDEVKVSQANYRPLTKTLTITAASSDQVAPPALQAYMPGMTAPLGTLVAGQLSVTFPVTDSAVTPPKTFQVPPQTVTIKSAAGGETTVPVVALDLVP